MSKKNMVMIDGNTAAAYVAHAVNEVIAIYPITPSSPMGELSDVYSAQGRENIWGTIPQVVEMQSEAGAAGAVHGALTTGALTTTFTASQGLLLMLPNMYKIAGELTPAVFHIAARAVSNQALSIFGDHSDVMSARSTGWAMLASSNIQETMDNALISQAATLESRIPFLHFFDGFRTSHEVQKVEELTYDDMRAMIDDELVHAHRKRGMTPENPVVRGTSQNPDVFFAARETVNKYYDATPGIVQAQMDKFAKMTGRQYNLFDYVGAPDADRLVIMMGSGSEAMEETVEELNKQGEKVGLLKVRLFRPFSIKHFVESLPKTVKAMACLDMTKEPGALGEPLYEDVRTAIGEAMSDGLFQFDGYPVIVGGRYGLGLNQHGLTPGMCKAVLDNLKAPKVKNHFTVGIKDDVTHTSLDYDPKWVPQHPGLHQALFFGLGSDGTVGANKNSIKIIGEATDNYAQGYFVYDSKKAGTQTVSHLRFGKERIKSTYLIKKADFVACHKWSFMEKYDMLDNAKEGATFLVNSPFSADQVWENLPVEVQQEILDKKLSVYTIDASDIAEKAGMGSRINIIMQTAFFKISGILPEDEAITLIKKYVEKTYGGKGQDIVDSNMKTIDMALEGIYKVDYPQKTTGDKHIMPSVPADAPKFVKEVIGEIYGGRGEHLPVSKLPEDGTFPTATSQYERRNIAEKIPVWNEEVCIQCGDCSAVCPHAVIRMKVYDPKYLKDAPATFKSAEAKGKGFEGLKFTIQVAAEDCTGCAACENICPAFKKVNGEKTDEKALVMHEQIPLRETELANWKYFRNVIPNTDESLINYGTTKGTQLLQPLFEFSGACAGCGETPYVKLISQLYGDRSVIANATGCSSIYGGNLPTTPYAKNDGGQGPTWSNSLFEDAAEFGFGMKLTSDKLKEYALELLDRYIAEPKGLDVALLKRIKENKQEDNAAIRIQRSDVEELRKQLSAMNDKLAKELLSSSDHLIRRSIWVFGGDGWAYDIGYGGLDHVIASGENINLLVMDTEVYSNTGGQMSKATPVGAIAQFAAAGKDMRKKDLGMMAMSYGYVYVAQIAMGFNRIQTLKAIQEAEAYDGPSIIIAYSHCISHGINMTTGMNQQKTAVTSGMWPLYRYNPSLVTEGKNPFQLDSKEPSSDVEEYLYNEVRFKALKTANPERAEALLAKIKKDNERRWKEYKYIAERPF